MRKMGNEVENQVGARAISFEVEIMYLECQSLVFIFTHSICSPNVYVGTAIGEKEKEDWKKCITPMSSTDEASEVTKGRKRKKKNSRVLDQAVCSGDAEWWLISIIILISLRNS